MAVTLGHLGTIGYTGASMNPARTVGTAFATNNWEAHWIYWTGPIMGGIAAALIYTQILEKPAASKVSEVSDKYRTHADEREVRVFFFLSIKLTICICICASLNLFAPILICITFLGKNRYTEMSLKNEIGWHNHKYKLLIL